VYIVTKETAGVKFRGGKYVYLQFPFGGGPRDSMKERRRRPQEKREKQKKRLDTSLIEFYISHL
jgi:hypothetical protein